MYKGYIPGNSQNISCFLRSKEESIPLSEPQPVIKERSLSEDKIKQEGGLKPPRFAGEKDLSIRAQLAGVEITLSDRNGDLLTAYTTGEGKLMLL